MRRLLLGLLVFAFVAAPRSALAADGLVLAGPEPSGVVRLEERDGRQVGAISYLVRVPGRRGGIVAVRYLPRRAAPELSLPNADLEWLTLVDADTGRPLSTAPAVRARTLKRISLWVLLPEGYEPRELDGRIALQLVRDGRRVGTPVVVRIAATHPGPPWSRIGVIASVISTALAALAAWLSGRSARQSRLARLEDRMPALLGQITRTGTGLTLEVRNAGGGIARHVSYCVVEGETRAEGTVGDGFLAPDASSSETVQFQRPDDAVGVLYAWDTAGDCYVWNLLGQRKHARRAGTGFTYKRAFRVHYRRVRFPE